LRGLISVFDPTRTSTTLANGGSGRLGGNITGVSYLTIDLTAKRLMCGIVQYFNFD